MNKTDYNNKTNEILSDENKYFELRDNCQKCN